MNHATANKRVLALDVHPRSFGFAVFEGPERLLDWGVRSYRWPGDDLRLRVAKNITALLADFAPSVAVVNELRPRAGKINPKLKKAFDTIRKQVAKYGTSVHLVTWRAVRKVFGRATKHEIVIALTDRYPELAWKAPPKRKCYQSEDYRMSIFDAAALGVAYFARHQKAPSQPT